MGCKTNLLKALTGLFCCLFFTSNCLLAYSPEVNFWSERRNAIKQTPSKKDSLALLAQLPVSLPALSSPSRVLISQKIPLSISKVVPSKLNSFDQLLKSLPQNFGAVRNLSPSSKGADSKIIFHIQDVHMNLEAQKNIAGIIRTMVAEQKADLIALEGAFRPIDLSAFRAFPDQDIICRVADHLLSENKISGPIHAAFSSPQNLPPVIGIDDTAHYKANVRAYKESTSRVQGNKKKLAEIENRVMERKRLEFNSSLARFDRTVQAFRQGTIELGEYVNSLSRWERNHAEGEGKRATVTSFLKALNLEKSLDFQKVESERNGLLSLLTKKLTQEETTELVSRSVSYRLGNLKHADFYQYLKDLCEKSKIHLGAFPSMDSFLQYILLSDSIDGEKLLAEIRALEKSIYASLAKTEEERRLIAESRHLYLIGKLLDFALTKDEWEEYESTIENRNLSSFERFYLEAEARDELLTKNLLKAMEEKKAKVAVLVAGGFHSKGIEKMARESGISIVRFVPRITKIEGGQGSAYLSVFSQQKTPLEKLFEGEKLFLAGNPISEGVYAEAGIKAYALGRQRAPSADGALKRWLQNFLHFKSLVVKNISERAFRMSGWAVSGADKLKRLVFEVSVQPITDRESFPSITITINPAVLAVPFTFFVMAGIKAFGYDLSWQILIGVWVVFWSLFREFKRRGFEFQFVFGLVPELSPGGSVTASVRWMNWRFLHKPLKMSVPNDEVVDPPHSSPRPPDSVQSTKDLVPVGLNIKSLLAQLGPECPSLRLNLIYDDEKQMKRQDEKAIRQSIEMAGDLYVGLEYCPVVDNTGREAGFKFSLAYRWEEGRSAQLKEALTLLVSSSDPIRLKTAPDPDAGEGKNVLSAWVDKRTARTAGGEDDITQFHRPPELAGTTEKETQLKSEPKPRRRDNKRKPRRAHRPALDEKPELLGRDLEKDSVGPPPQEALSTETEKPETPKPASPHSVVPVRPASQRPEDLRAEAPRAEAPRAEAPRAEAPRAEAPRAGVSEESEPEPRLGPHQKNALLVIEHWRKKENSKRTLQFELKENGETAVPQEISRKARKAKVLVESGKPNCIFLKYREDAEEELETILADLYHWAERIGRQSKITFSKGEGKRAGAGRKGHSRQRGGGRSADLENTERGEWPDSGTDARPGFHSGKYPIRDAIMEMLLLFPCTTALVIFAGVMRFFMAGSVPIYFAAISIIIDAVILFLLADVFSNWHGEDAFYQVRNIFWQKKEFILTPSMFDELVRETYWHLTRVFIISFFLALVVLINPFIRFSALEYDFAVYLSFALAWVGTLIKHILDNLRFIRGHFKWDIEKVDMEHSLSLFEPFFFYRRWEPGVRPRLNWLTNGLMALSEPGFDPKHNAAHKSILHSLQYLPYSYGAFLTWYAREMDQKNELHARVAQVALKERAGISLDDVQTAILDEGRALEKELRNDIPLIAYARDLSIRFLHLTIAVAEALPFIEEPGDRSASIAFIERLIQSGMPLWFDVEGVHSEALEDAMWMLFSTVRPAERRTLAHSIMRRMEKINLKYDYFKNNPRGNSQFEQGFNIPPQAALDMRTLHFLIRILEVVGPTMEDDSMLRLDAALASKGKRLELLLSGHPRQIAQSVFSSAIIIFLSGKEKNSSSLKKWIPDPRHAAKIIDDIVSLGEELLFAEAHQVEVVKWAQWKHRIQSALYELAPFIPFVFFQRRIEGRKIPSEIEELLVAAMEHKPRSPAFSETKHGPEFVKEAISFMNERARHVYFDSHVENYHDVESTTFRMSIEQVSPGHREHRVDVNLSKEIFWEDLTNRKGLDYEALAQHIVAIAVFQPEEDVANEKDFASYVLLNELDDGHLRFKFPLLPPGNFSIQFISIDELIGTQKFKLQKENPMKEVPTNFNLLDFPKELRVPESQLNRVCFGIGKYSIYFVKNGGNYEVHVGSQKDLEIVEENDILDPLFRSVFTVGSDPSNHIVLSEQHHGAHIEPFHAQFEFIPGVGVVVRPRFGGRIGIQWKNHEPKQLPNSILYLLTGSKFWGLSGLLFLEIPLIIAWAIGWNWLCGCGFFMSGAYVYWRGLSGSLAATVVLIRLLARLHVYLAGRNPAVWPIRVSPQEQYGNHLKYFLAYFIASIVSFNALPSFALLLIPVIVHIWLDVRMMWPGIGKKVRSIKKSILNFFFHIDFFRLAFRSRADFFADLCQDLELRIDEEKIRFDLFFPEWADEKRFKDSENKMSPLTRIGIFPKRILATILHSGEDRTNSREEVMNYVRSLPVAYKAALYKLALQVLGKRGAERLYQRSGISLPLILRAISNEMSEMKWDLSENSLLNDFSLERARDYGNRFLNLMFSLSQVFGFLEDDFSRKSILREVINLLDLKIPLVYEQRRYSERKLGAAFSDFISHLKTDEQKAFLTQLYRVMDGYDFSYDDPAINPTGDDMEEEIDSEDENLQVSLDFRNRAVLMKIVSRALPAMMGTPELRFNGILRTVASKMDLLLSEDPDDTSLSAFAGGEEFSGGVVWDNDGLGNSKEWRENPQKATEIIFHIFSLAGEISKAEQLGLHEIYWNDGEMYEKPVRWKNWEVSFQNALRPFASSIHYALKKWETNGKGPIPVEMEEVIAPLYNDGLLEDSLQAPMGLAAQRFCQILNNQFHDLVFDSQKDYSDDSIEKKGWPGKLPFLNNDFRVSVRGVLNQVKEEISFGTLEEFLPGSMIQKIAAVAVFEDGRRFISPLMENYLFESEEFADFRFMINHLPPGRFTLHFHVVEKLFLDPYQSFEGGRAVSEPNSIFYLLTGSKIAGIFGVLLAEWPGISLISLGSKYLFSVSPLFWITSFGSFLVTLAFLYWFSSIHVKVGRAHPEIYPIRGSPNKQMLFHLLGFSPYLLIPLFQFPSIGVLLSVLVWHLLWDLPLIFMPELKKLAQKFRGKNYFKENKITALGKAVLKSAEGLIHGHGDQPVGQILGSVIKINLGREFEDDGKDGTSWSERDLTALKDYLGREIGRKIKRGEINFFEAEILARKVAEIVGPRVATADLLAQSEWGFVIERGEEKIVLEFLSHANIDQMAATFFISETDREYFEKFIEQLPSSLKEIRFSLISGDNLFREGHVVDLDTFEDALWTLDENRFINLMFAMPENKNFSGGASLIRGPQRWKKVQFVLLEEILSGLVSVKVKSLGLILELAKIISQFA